MPLNPFVWTGPIQDGVLRAEFTRRTCLTLKAGTHVAMFGPRGTGKTSFVAELANDLRVEQEADAPRWETLQVDLGRAISLPAFVGAVSDSVDRHPDSRLRRRAASAFSSLEKELGVNLGVVKAGVRSGGARAVADPGEVLHNQLRVLGGVADRLVVVLDEFQRLANCPGEPLSLIRSALMGPEHAGRVSLLLTGSLRERLRLMLHNDTEPIWDQTHDVELPAIDVALFADYLDQRFVASGKPADARAVELLLELCDAHPKRTQHVAWHVWERAWPGATIAPEDVSEAFDALLASGQDNTDFAKVIDTLLSGDDTDTNDVRALFLLASGASAGSNLDSIRYGLKDQSAAVRAVRRLRDRGLVQGGDPGEPARIVDPLLAAWLRSTDPLLD